MKRSQIMESNHQCNMPWVFKDGDWYYMTAQGPYFAREVYIYRSKTPYARSGCSLSSPVSSTSWETQPITGSTW